MKHASAWMLRVAALCCAVCTVYGVVSLILVQQRLDEGTAAVRVLLEGTAPENPPRVAETSESKIDRDAEGLLCFARYEIAVFHGVTEETLTKGAGHIPASAELNKSGNCVLYGHRDSAFRFMAKLREDDVLRLWTPSGEKQYRVTSILIMEPDDPAIFTQTQTGTLSLVTCYPFTFVGPALQRCVVRAVEMQPENE